MKDIETYKNKIICGNCLEIMKDMPDESIDLVVTSPPYNFKKILRNGRKQNFKRKTATSYNNLTK